MEDIKVTYDKHGFMEYNPVFHARQYEKWTREEDEYLLNYYKYDGLESISMGLERKPTTVYGRVHTLRRWGYKFKWVMILKDVY